MPTERSLNQIVKGAPPPDSKLPPPAPLPSLATASSETVGLLSGPKRSKHAHAPSVSDSAISSLPSSPPQIYLNLLILEASLRLQYLHLMSRRRLNTFFMLLLAAWNGFFVWALFLRPREDGQGHGGSVYWVVETAERLAFMGGVLTALLVKATGQWERGIRWPRRWLVTTNRGLRGFNLRVVVTKGKWWREMLGIFAFLLPFGLWREAGGSDWHFVELENGNLVEEDLAKGGDQIMLFLLPKNFSSEFRENWEAYRLEYWDRENERRAALRKKVRQHRRTKAKEHGGWKWWTGFWRLSGVGHRGGGGARRGYDLEKHPHSRQGASATEKDMLMKSTRRRSIMRDGSHSRRSSRNSISLNQPPDLDGGLEMKALPLNERVRRGSSVSSTSSVRRSTRSSRRDVLLSPLTAANNNNTTDADDDHSTNKDKRAFTTSKKKERDRGINEKDKMGNSRPTTPDSSDTTLFAERVPTPA